MNISQLHFYPRTVAVVKDLPRLLKDNSNVSFYFYYQAHINQYETQNYLRTDHYPDIRPVMNLVSERHKNTIWGHTPLNNTYIEIRENLLKDLQAAKDRSSIMALGFLTAVTLLHELVHYGRNHKKVVEDANKDPEPGTRFEGWAFGNYIEDNNAHMYCGRYENSFIHLKQTIIK